MAKINVCGGFNCTRFEKVKRGDVFFITDEGGVLPGALPDPIHFFIKTGRDTAANLQTGEVVLVGLDSPCVIAKSITVNLGD